MEFGGIFILIVVLVVLAIVGTAIYAIAARGRQRQLSAKGGSLDAGRGLPTDEDERPQHVEVDTEQRARFIGSR